MKLELNSERLVLMPLAPTDLDLCLEMFTDPEVVEYFGDLMNEVEICEEMSNWIKRGGNGCIGIWSISNSETGEKFGTIALLPLPIEDDDTDYSLVVPGKMGFINRGTMRCYCKVSPNFRISRDEWSKLQQTV